MFNSSSFSAGETPTLAKWNYLWDNDDYLYDNLHAHDYKARAYLSADQNNLVHNTWTKIELDTVDYDPNGDFDITTNNRYVFPISGEYLIMGSVFIEGAEIVAEKMYAAGIYINGSRVQQKQQHASSAPNGLSIDVGDIKRVTAGQYVELWGFSGSGNNLVDVEAGSVRTFLAVHLLAQSL